MGIGRRGTSTMSKYKAARARSAVAKAAQLLRARSSSSTPYSSISPAVRSYLRGPELKFLDSTATNVAVTTTWQGLLINGIAQGSDFNQRIGRKSTMKSILFNGNFFPTASTANAYQGIYMRTVIIYDTQPNSGTFPTGTDIFVSNDPNSPLNLNNRDRFQVLLDVRKQLGSFQTDATPKLVAGSPSNAYWNKYRKCNKETIFSGTAATLASISTGSMYLFFIGDFNSVSMIDYYTRIRFTDM
jgi:hypothetical protein